MLTTMEALGGAGPMEPQGLRLFQSQAQRFDAPDQRDTPGGQVRRLLEVRPRTVNNVSSA